MQSEAKDLIFLFLIHQLLVYIRDNLKMKVRERTLEEYKEFGTHFLLKLKYS